MSATEPFTHVVVCMDGGRLAFIHKVRSRRAADKVVDKWQASFASSVGYHGVVSPDDPLKVVVKPVESQHRAITYRAQDWATIERTS